MGFDSSEAALRATAPARSLKAVTPDATLNLPDGVCSSLWIGGAGNVAVIAEEDTTAVTIIGCAAGSRLHIRAKAVRVAGTTATNIVAFY